MQKKHMVINASELQSRHAARYYIAFFNQILLQFCFVQYGKSKLNDGNFARLSCFVNVAAVLGVGEQNSIATRYLIVNGI